MKKLSLIIVLVLCSFIMNAQKKEKKLKLVDTDTIVEKVRQQGYFQKAYVDPGDPRFMMTNADNTFQFGIGGIIHATAIYDINGANNNKDFVTWSIPVPTAHTQQFGIDMGGTRLIAKGVSKVGKRELVAVLEFNVGTGTTVVKMRNAYVSFAGFTIGRTYTFFQDLDAGPMTVDNQGPNTQIDNKHPLVGYRISAGKHFDFGVAAEEPNLNMTDHDSTKVYKDFQKAPDATAFVKFHWKTGHVQFSQLCRWMYYGYGNQSLQQYDDLNKKCVFGYGGALSGKIYIIPKLFFTFQVVTGRGIASYIQELANSNLDLVTCLGSQKMKPLTTTGGYAAFQYDFNDKWFASITGGFVNIHRYNDENYFDTNIGNFKTSYYVAINGFRQVFSHGMIGLEYLYGQRVNLDANDVRTVGRAHRIDFMLKYTF